MAIDWTRARDLFEAALDLAPAEQTAFLDHSCGADPELRREVDELLEADAGEPAETGSADPLTPGGVAAFLVEGSDGSLAGAALGSYRLVRAIGSGGMGTVYEARQESPRRTVAVKVLNLGLVAPESLRRFEREAETLAALRHPGIAQVYESGVAALGDEGAAVRVPYLAMELVEGSRTLVEHCAAHGLDTGDRVDLFLQVADAVHFAHQRGVLHRDLKPQNLLVAEDGDRPCAKVIDFGIARTLEDASRGLTRTGVVLGTLATMAPEQLDAEGGAGLDARADVYALSAVLHELLTGRPPLELDGLALPEAARRIRDQTPPPPSRLRPELPRELDWVVARGLEKEPGRRYPSVAALADDLRRLRAHEPVHAGPPSAAYRARKFVRRNRVLVASLAAIVLALSVALAFTSWGLLRARRAEAAAERRSDDLAALNRFMEALLTAPDAAAHGWDARVADVLEHAEETVAAELAGDPALELQQRATLARVFLALGAWERAHAQSARCLELLGPEPDPEALRDHRLDLLSARLELGLHAEAERLVCGFLESCRDEDEPHYLLKLGQILNARGEERRAEEPLRAALAFPGFESGEVAHSTLSQALRAQGRFTESLEHAERSLAIREAEEGAGSPRTLVPHAEIARLFIDRGEVDEAVAILLEQIERHEPRHGPAHPWILLCREFLAGAYLAAGDPDGALVELESCVARARERFGDRHLRVADLLANLGGLRTQLGDLPAAERAFRESHAIYSELRGPADLETVRRLGLLRIALERQGRVDESVALAEEALEELPPASEAALELRRRLAVQLDRLGRRDEAEEAYRAALADARAALAEDALLPRKLANDLGLLLFRRGALDEAAGLLAASIEASRRARGDFHGEVITSLANLALLHARAGAPGRGEALLQDQLELARRRHGPHSPEACMSMAELDDYLRARGEPERAAALYEPLLAEPPGPEPEPLHLGSLRAAWAELLEEAGDLGRAREQLRLSLASYRAGRGPAARAVRSLEAWLADLE